MLLERFGLWEARGERTGSYSRGMLQRLTLCRALLHDPELLILDEPANALDAAGEDLLDRKMIVRPLESIEWTRRLVEEAGLFAGLSSGAALAGAAKAAAAIDEGVIVTLAPDGGWKYLSTGAWTDPLEEVARRAESIIYF